MSATVRSLPHQVVSSAGEFNEAQKTAALPYSNELLPLVRTYNYLVGHGYPVVPTIMNPEETLVASTDYVYSFGIIPRDNEVSTVISVNRIHYIQLSGTAGNVGEITVQCGIGEFATEVASKVYVIGPDGWWNDCIVQALTYTQVDETYNMVISPETGNVNLRSYGCFEMPRYEINPVSAGRGVDEATFLKNCTIYTGTTNTSCNHLFNTDALNAGRRVLFSWGAFH